MAVYTPISIHLKALIDICHNQGLERIPFMLLPTIRDCDPKSGLGFITELQQHLNQTTGKIATVSGKYYAMDRDKNGKEQNLSL